MSDIPLSDVVHIDRLIHEPARLVIMSILYVTDGADFLYLLRETKLTKGNLSSHLARLEKAGYVEIDKQFEGKIPRTLCRLTDEGREAFGTYIGKMKGMLGGLAD